MEAGKVAGTKTMPDFSGFCFGKKTGSSEKHQFRTDFEYQVSRNR
jgi:hypothetical protein